MINLSRWHAHICTKEGTRFGTILQHICDRFRNLSNGQGSKLYQWESSNGHFFRGKIELRLVEYKHNSTFSLQEKLGSNQQTIVHRWPRYGQGKQNKIWSEGTDDCIKTNCNCTEMHGKNFPKVPSFQIRESRLSPLRLECWFVYLFLLSVFCSILLLFSHSNAMFSLKLLRNGPVNGARFVFICCISNPISN